MAGAKVKRLNDFEYWDEHYTGVGPEQQAHEWYKSFGDLEPLFNRHLFQVRGPETIPKILHLGSGDSTIPEDLARKGYGDQLCVDFSSVVVKTMSARHASIRGIQWMQMDVRQMDSIPSESIDVAFDKGTLCAMVHGDPWNPPDDVLDNSSRYMREVYRVLKPDATFIYVSYHQPHFLKPLLNCEGVDWEMETNIIGGSDSSFHYHGFVLKRKKRISTTATTS